MSELAYLSATEALARFRSKELSPVELLDALIERIEDVDQEINPVCDRRYVEGRAEAKVSEARYAGKGDAPRALGARRSEGGAPDGGAQLFDGLVDLQGSRGR